MIVSQLDLPDKAIAILESKGVRTLYPTQALAIKAGVLEGANVVLSSPTASGKTLVAVLAIIKHVLEGKGISLYLTPLRALAAEKYEELRSLGESLGFKVALTTGDYDSSDPWLENYDVIVTTNEKADSLVRHRAPWIKRVSLLVVDEVHLLGLDRRGPVLEMLIARLKRLKRDVQVLALSATIRNIDDIASWLNAKSVVSDWRPVKLKEGVYYDGAIYFDSGEVRNIEDSGDPITSLTLDGLREGGQVLIFVSTRSRSLRLARRLAPKVYGILKKGERGALTEASHSLLRIEKNIVVEKLADLVSMGVGFHHAGLSYNVRRFIEEAFRKNLLKVIVATPTLAAGVNLPARRVILADYRRFNVEVGRYELIPVMEYKQMAGRAGRPQYDKYGEAILVAKTADEFELLMEEYVNSLPERIISRLASEPMLRGQLLASIASGFVESRDGVFEVMRDTLFAAQFSLESITSLLDEALDFLIKEGLVESYDSYL
ncbi:MAG: extensin, partial [Thermoprotei archaeon]